MGTRLSWNGPGVAPFQNHIRWPRLPTKIFFSPLTLPGEFLDIFYMNYAFDLTQNITKPNIYTCCSSSNISICCSLCGFYRVENCIATSGLVVWLVGSFQSTLSEIAKQNVLGDSMWISINKGRNPSNAKLSDFFSYIDSQTSARRKNKK